MARVEATRARVGSSLSNSRAAAVLCAAPRVGSGLAAARGVRCTCSCSRRAAGPLALLELPAAAKNRRLPGDRRRCGDSRGHIRGSSSERDSSAKLRHLHGRRPRPPAEQRGARGAGRTEAEPEQSLSAAQRRQESAQRRRPCAAQRRRFCDVGLAKGWPAGQLGPSATGFSYCNTSKLEKE